MQSYQSNPVAKFLVGELGREIFIEGVKETYENTDFHAYSNFQYDNTMRFSTDPFSSSPTY